MKKRETPANPKTKPDASEEELVIHTAEFTMVVYKQPKGKRRSSAMKVGGIPWTQIKSFVRTAPLPDEDWVP